jgi:hypothetical protein
VNGLNAEMQPKERMDRPGRMTALVNRFWSRLRQTWSETRWLLLGIFWLVGLILGWAGFAQFSQEHGRDWSAGDLLYRTLQLIILEAGSVDGRVNWMLETARFLLPALTAYTAFQAVMHLFREQTQWLRLWRVGDHVIVAGLGRKGSHLVRELLALGRPVVAIEKDPAHEELAELRRQGAIVLVGDATNSGVQTSARIQRARHLVSLTGNDGVNLRIASQAYQQTPSRRRGRLTCVTHLDSPELLSLIKDSELTIDPTVPFQLESFNSYARAARLLLQLDPGWQPTRSGDEVPRSILVIGLGRMGESLIFNAGYAWHLLRRPEELGITVLDLEAESKVSDLLRRQPRLSQVCRFVPLEMDVCPTDLLHERLQLTPGGQPFHRVYICLSDPVVSLQVCLNLVRMAGQRPASIHARLARESGLSEFTRNPLPGLFEATRVHTFDLYEQTCSADLLLSGSHEQLARDLHAAYLAGSGEPSGQGAHLSWEQSSEETREANRRQADRIQCLLQTAGYRINPLHDWDAAERVFREEEILMMARLEHDFWRKAKEADGWRLGPQRDEKRRTHPDLVPWEGLDDVEREKNLTFVRQLPGLLARIGFQIDRVEGIRLAGNRTT